jgi:alkylation response protein AidB-like acyl-CoA dehydrogenase
MLINELRDRLPAILDREAAQPEAYPKENLADLFAIGAISAAFPREAGGDAATLLENVSLVRELAAASPSTALLAVMPLGLAEASRAGALLAPAGHRSTARAQMERLAAEYAAGRFYAACNSEKGAGGSLSNIKTRIDRSGEGFVIEGEKILASGGVNASVFFSTAKVEEGLIPEAGEVELFFVDVGTPGVNILTDWDGFGMRPTESQTVRYEGAAVRELMGFPGYLQAVSPLPYWFCLFAAIPLGCASAVLDELSTPAPSAPALRLRLSEARMRYEALEAYLAETARGYEPGPALPWRNRVLRTKTYVSQESTKLCAELFALSGGRHYRRTGRVARLLADSFAGTALRPPLPLALEQLSGDAFEDA